jgi:hypothetical protein
MIIFYAKNDPIFVSFWSVSGPMRRATDEFLSTPDAAHATDEPRQSLKCPALAKEN